MPTVKTAVKKPSKPAKKVTLDDVWETMRELQELRKETEAGFRELQRQNVRTGAGTGAKEP